MTLHVLNAWTSKQLAEQDNIRPHQRLALRTFRRNRDRIKLFERNGVLALGARKRMHVTMCFDQILRAGGSVEPIDVLR